jgi:integrase
LTVLKNDPGEPGALAGLGRPEISQSDDRSRLTEIPFHGLRHSHPTARLAAAQNPQDVQERLGHYCAAFTLNCYAAVPPNMQPEAPEKVSALVHEQRIHN